MAIQFTFRMARRVRLALVAGLLLIAPAFGDEPSPPVPPATPVPPAVPPTAQPPVREAEKPMKDALIDALPESLRPAALAVEKAPDAASLKQALLKLEKAEEDYAYKAAVRSRDLSKRDELLEEIAAADKALAAKIGEELKTGDIGGAGDKAEEILSPYLKKHVEAKLGKVAKRRVDRMVDQYVSGMKRLSQVVPERKDWAAVGLGTWQEARKEALELIHDGKRYPAKSKEGQKEVNEKVKVVKEAYVGVAAALEQDCRGLIGPGGRLLGAEIGRMGEMEAAIETGRNYVAGKEGLKLKPTTLAGVSADRLMGLKLVAGVRGGQGAGLWPALERRDDEWKWIGWWVMSKMIMEANAELAASGKSTTDKEELELVRLTNAYRMEMGLMPVRLDERLVQAARGHSQEMANLGYFGHESPTPGRKSPGDRAKLAGYRSGSVAENIAMNSGGITAAASFHMWYNSAGHHRNILGGGFAIGVGKTAKNMTQVLAGAEPAGADKAPPSNIED